MKVERKIGIDGKGKIVVKLIVAAHKINHRTSRQAHIEQTFLPLETDVKEQSVDKQYLEKPIRLKRARQHSRVKILLDIAVTQKTIIGKRQHQHKPHPEDYGNSPKTVPQNARIVDFAAKNKRTHGKKRRHSKPLQSANKPINQVRRLLKKSTMRRHD